MTRSNRSSSPAASAQPMKPAPPVTKHVPRPFTLFSPQTCLDNCKYNTEDNHKFILPLIDPLRIKFLEWGLPPERIYSSSNNMYHNTYQHTFLWKGRPREYQGRKLRYSPTAPFKIPSHDS